jgi:hypothetical protein
MNHPGRGLQAASGKRPKEGEMDTTKVVETHDTETRNIEKPNTEAPNAAKPAPYDVGKSHEAEVKTETKTETETKTGA